MGIRLWLHEQMIRGKLTGRSDRTFAMSRFANLELGNQFEEPGQPRRQAALKGEAYYLEQAREAYTAGRFDQGLRSYARVLEHNPECTEAWTGQVRMLIELKEYKEAKLWADKALQRFPNAPELIAVKAVALARMGDVQGAIAYSDASFDERENTPFLWLARGDVLLAKKEKRADFCFDKAASLAPHDWFVRWLAARVYHFYEKFSKAIDWAQQAIELNGGQGVAWLLMGQSQMALGMTGAARVSLQQARELSTNSSEADAAMRQLSRQGMFDGLRNRWRQWFSS